MAGNMNLQLLISASGGQKTIAELLAIQAALNKTAKESGSITGLANAMGGTYAQAKRLSEGLGLSAEKATAAVNRLKELNAVNADGYTKFATLNKELGITAEQFGKLDQAANSTKQGMAGVAAISGAVAAAIGATFAKGTQQFADFDQELRTFGVVTQSLDTKAFEEVRSEVERLAASTSKSPQELAKLATELGRAGFTADQVKDSLAGVVQSSEATGEGLIRTGEVIGAAIGQFGLAATDSTRIADLLTTASNASAVGTNDLGEALSYVGAQAKASNQSIEDTITTLALLGAAGIKGSSAGTGLAEALRRIKIASAAASTELDELKARGSKSAVAAFEKLNGEVRDSNGQLKPFPQILATVKNSLGTLGQGDQDLLMNALFGVQGGRTIQSLLGLTDEKVKQITGSMNEFEGSSKKASQEMNQGLKRALEQLAGSAEQAGIDIGEIVSVGIVPLVKGATELIKTFLNLPGPVQAALVVTTGFVGVLAAAIAAVAAYNLANGSRIVAEVRATAATITGTGALLAQKAVMLANTQITVGLVAAKIAQAAAAGKVAAAQAIANAAMAAGTITAGGLAAATLAVVGPMLALAGAIALAYWAKHIQELRLVNEELDALNANSSASGNEFAKIGAKVKGLNSAFKEAGKFTEDQKRTAEAYLKISKDKIKSLDDEIAAAKAIQPANDEQKNAQQALIAGLEAQKRALTSQTAELEKNLQSQNSNNAAKRDGAKASKKNKEEIEAEVEALKKKRQAQKEASQRDFDDRERATDRQLDDEREQRQRSADQAREQRQRDFDDAKAQREQAFQQQKESAERDFNKRKESADKAFKKSQAKEDEAFKKSQAKEDERFKKSQNVAQEKFTKAQRSEEDTFQKGLKKAEADFQKVQQAAQKTFQKQQQAAERAFQKELEDRKNAQNKSFSEAQRQLAAEGDPDAQRNLQKMRQEEEQIRNLNLTDVILNPDAIIALAKQITGITKATTDEEKQRLQDTIAKLQEEQRRQQESADKSKSEQFKESQSQADADFKNKQQTEEDEFKLAQQEKEKAFKLELQQAEADFKLAQQELEKGFRESQQVAETVFRESQQKAEDDFKLNQQKAEADFKLNQQSLERAFKKSEEDRERQFKDEQRAEEQSFKDQEKAKDRKEQDDRLGRERKFKDEQRKLDEENERKIKALKDQSESKQTEAAQQQETAADKQLQAAQIQQEVVNNPPPGRRYGGNVAAGQMYEVGESGREFFVPSQNGYIINSWQANRIAREVLSAGQVNAMLQTSGSLSLVPTLPTNQTSSDLGKQFDRLEKKLQRLGDATFALASSRGDITIHGSKDGMDAALKVSAELQKQLRRAKGA